MSIHYDFYLGIGVGLISYDYIRLRIVNYKKSKLDKQLKDEQQSLIADKESEEILKQLAKE